jgi:hypothetical protein
LCWLFSITWNGINPLALFPQKNSQHSQQSSQLPKRMCSHEYGKGPSSICFDVDRCRNEQQENAVLARRCFGAVARMKLFLILLALVALACSVPAQVPTVSTKPVPTVLRPAPKQPTELLATVTATSLHVRQQPSEKSPLVSVDSYLYHGDTVTIQDCADGWAQIEWQGGTAWVKADWLSDNECKE